MKLIPASVLALSLLATAAPFAAFAQDGASSGSDDAVQLNANPTKSSLGVIGGVRELFHVDGGAHVEAGDDRRIPIDATTTFSARGPHDGKNSPASTTATTNHGNGEQVRGHGDAEITNRIDSLNKMIARLGDTMRLSTDAKASLTAELNAQITALTNLRDQINAEATTTLKTDVKSITKDFRIYALVMPKAAINAAADRIMTIAAQMETLSAKITARITAAQAAGADVSAAVTAHTDFDAKVADAKVQAVAAVNEVANLSVDAGATTTLAANTSALKDARTKINAAQADLKAARKDVDTILKAIRGKGEVQATTTASTH